LNATIPPGFHPEWVINVLLPTLVLVVAPFIFVDFNLAKIGLCMLEISVQIVMDTPAWPISERLHGILSKVLKRSSRTLTVTQGMEKTIMQYLAIADNKGDQKLLAWS
jgi:hypothetical protein